MRIPYSALASNPPQPIGQWRLGPRSKERCEYAGHRKDFITWLPSRFSRLEWPGTGVLKVPLKYPQVTCALPISSWGWAICVGEDALVERRGPNGERQCLGDWRRLQAVGLDRAWKSTLPSPSRSSYYGAWIMLEGLIPRPTPAARPRHSPAPAFPTPPPRTPATLAPYGSIRGGGISDKTIDAKVPSQAERRPPSPMYLPSAEDVAPRTPSVHRYLRPLAAEAPGACSATLVRTLGLPRSEGRGTCPGARTSYLHRAFLRCWMSETRRLEGSVFDTRSHLHLSAPAVVIANIFLLSSRPPHRPRQLIPLISHLDLGVHGSRSFLAGLLASLALFLASAFPALAFSCVASFYSLSFFFFLIRSLGLFHVPLIILGALHRGPRFVHDIPDPTSAPAGCSPQPAADFPLRAIFLNTHRACQCYQFEFDCHGAELSGPPLPMRYPGRLYRPHQSTGTKQH